LKENIYLYNIITTIDFRWLKNTPEVRKGITVHTYRKGSVYQSGRRWEVQSRISDPDTMGTSMRLVPMSAKDRVSDRIRARPP